MKENDEIVDIKERRFFLGYLEGSHPPNYKDLQDAIEQSGTTHLFLTSHGYETNQFEVRSYQTIITEGVIFDNISECLKYLKAGITYYDIIDGHEMLEGYEK